MRYAVVEDEKISRDLLCLIVKQLYPMAVKSFECASVRSAVDFLSQNEQPDIIFMDVELSDGNCFAIFDAVNVQSSIIFVTAYEKFSLKAFSVMAIDYIVKPIDKGQVALAINKYERMIRQNSLYIKQEEKPMSSSYDSSKERILIVSGDSYSYINIDDVAMLKSEDRYVFVYLRNGQKKMTNYMNLSEIEKVLNSSKFFRLSRSIIVSITSIAKVEKYFKGRLSVRIKTDADEEKIIVSALRKDEFLKWLGV